MGEPPVTWTTVKPTEAGWYYWRRDSASAPYLFEICLTPVAASPLSAMRFKPGVLATLQGGEWSSRLPKETVEASPTACLKRPSAIA